MNGKPKPLTRNQQLLLALLEALPKLTPDEKKIYHELVKLKLLYNRYVMKHPKDFQLNT